MCEVKNPFVKQKKKKKFHAFGNCCPFEFVDCSKADQEICLNQDTSV